MVAALTIAFGILGYFMVAKQIAQPGAYQLKEQAAINRGDYAEVETLRRRRTAGAQPVDPDRPVMGRNLKLR